MTARRPQHSEGKRKTKETRAGKRKTKEARTLVFAYGTLLTGEPNHRLLKGAQLITESRTRPEFTLHDLRFYPGLVRGGTHAVVGEVYEVDEPTLAALDRLEGHPDFYCRTCIVLENGFAVQAYLLTAATVAGWPVIASGNWRTRKR